MPCSSRNLHPELSLEKKKVCLREILSSMKTVLVAFSGGVDSSFLLKSAHDVLGSRNVLAAIGDSETLAREEFSEARDFLQQYGIRSVVVKTDELTNEWFRANPRNRCFYCKDELFGKLKEVLSAESLAVVIDGTNADDLHDHRPGRKAAQAHGVRSPLAEAALGKKEIRRLSREMGLPTWDKPAVACLASRFPYGERITVESLSQVERAEEAVKRLGFRNVRVRAHQSLARIEVDRENVAELLATEIVSTLKALGFLYVTVDLEGFRSGSMNVPSD